MTRIVVRRRPIRVGRPLLTVTMLLAVIWWMCTYRGGAVEPGQPALDAWRRTAGGWERGYWTTPTQPACQAPLHPALLAALLAMTAAMSLNHDQSGVDRTI